MSVQVGYRKQFLLCIILLLCLFSIIELSARFYEYFLQPCGVVQFPGYGEYDYFLKRHICYDQHTLAYSNTPVLTIIPNQHFRTIDINNDGFRNAEINTPKTNQNYRIFIIGGSTVFGSGLINGDLTIPAQLNKKIQENYSNVEVINAGISSITSFEELYHFKEKLIHMEPNMVIFYDGSNDVTYKNIDPKIQNTDNDNKLKLKYFQQFLRSPIVIYRYVLLPIINLDIMNNSNMNSTFSNYSSSDYNDKISLSIASLWYDHVSEFCQISNEIDIKSVVIIQPTLWQNKKSHSSFEESIYVNDIHVEKTFDMLIQKSNELNNCSGVYDFTYAFENVTSTVYMDPVHLYPYGNQIIADQIYEKIIPIVIEDIKSKTNQ